MQTCDRCGAEIDTAQDYIELKYLVKHNKPILHSRFSLFIICNKCDESFAEWLEAEW